MAMSGVILLEANDDWQLRLRSMQSKAMAGLHVPHAEGVLAQYTSEAP